MLLTDIDFMLFFTSDNPMLALNYSKTESGEENIYVPHRCTFTSPLLNVVLQAIGYKWHMSGTVCKAHARCIIYVKRYFSGFNDLNSNIQYVTVFT